jgi:hypothetical protein
MKHYRLVKEKDNTTGFILYHVDERTYGRWSCILSTITHSKKVAEDKFHLLNQGRSLKEVTVLNETETGIM